MGRVHIYISTYMRGAVNRGGGPARAPKVSKSVGFFNIFVGSGLKSGGFFNIFVGLRLKSEQKCWVFQHFREHEAKK